ncbi:MAG: hypothetical protein GWO38_29845 [Phycisphaerae bacterium]|nr:hypothetical protein [Phycisphaerae bacterium]NIX31719.1 hypothetical protein [Phycisphaerae bacterium]
MKKFVFLCLIFVLFLTACRGGEPEATETETESATTVAEAAQGTDGDTGQESTPVEEAPTATATEPPAVEEAAPATPTLATASQAEGQPEDDGGIAECNLDPLNLSKNTAIPEITSADWRHGNLEARIQVIEYGDFQ